MIARFDLTKHLSHLPSEGRVLVAPLCWGIGHATRCIPLIEQLQEKGYQPIIASDGEALKLLLQIFPALSFIELPGYQISYAQNPKWFFLKLLNQLPKFFNTYRREHRVIKDLVKRDNIAAIISDNRFGVYHKDIPSIYITHQLRVKAGFWTYLATKVHGYFISKFTTSWIPDRENTPNLSGDLSHNISISKSRSYIGILSQFKKRVIPIKYDILVLLSGPEPQRSLLEQTLKLQLQNSSKRICFVKGIISDSVERTKKNNVTYYNYLLKDALEVVMIQSDLIIARSGYTGIMDLAVLQKKAFFIPTPGQNEQIYLAEHLEKQKIAPFSFQKDFDVSMLKNVAAYRGFLP